MVLVDPAKTVKIHSDYTAVECWGFDSVLNRIYLFDLVRAKLYPEQIYETAWDMARRHKTFNIKAEVTSLNAFMTYPFNQFLRQKGFPPIGELSARGKKQDRIAQLAPLYRMGSVYHNPEKKICGPLEAELLAFPRGKFDDCADCAGYLIPAFEIESKFFALEEADAPEDMEAALALLNEMDMEEMPAQTNYQWAP
jgi:predicted phage terminase large subunit-like protein